MKPAFPCALFFGLALGALAQTGSEATPEELEQARKSGAGMALADARNGKFEMPSAQVPKGAPWIREWVDLVPQRGFAKWPFVCLSGASEAQLGYFVVYSEAYDQVMLEQIKLRFGNDIFARLEAEAKALYEAKNAPKPSTPKPASSQSKKRRS